MVKVLVEVGAPVVGSKTLATRVCVPATEDEIEMDSTFSLSELPVK